MPIIPFIALRFLKTGTRRHFPFLTVIAVIGVFLSVFSFVVIHSVMNGFSSHIRDSLIGFNAHVTIPLPNDSVEVDSMRAWLDERPEVTGLSLVSELSGVIEVPGGSMAGVKIRGIDPPDFTSNPALEITPFEEEEGEPLALEGRGAILIGEELFLRLGLVPGGPELVRLLLPLGDVGPTGEVVPEIREFRVTGVFSTGFYDHDARYVMISRDDAEGFSELSKPKRHLFVRLLDPDDSHRVIEEFRKRWPGIIATSWQERDRRVLSALKLEKTAMILLLSVVTAIASFGILGLVTLFALRRLRDMALLLALGLPNSSLGKIPLLTGAAIGLAGTLAGFILGLGSVFYLANNPPLLPPAYYVDFLPVKIDPVTLAVVAVMAPLFAVAASLWPSRRFSKMATVDLLRST